MNYLYYDWLPYLFLLPALILIISYFIRIAIKRGFVAFIIALGNDEGLGLERILYITASLYSASIVTIQSDQGSTRFKYSSALII